MYRRSTGFTLIELIIVIGLIALVSGLVVTGTRGILSGLGERPVEETLRFAVREARYQAAHRKETTVLRFDAGSASFSVETLNGARLKEFPTGYGRDDRLDVRFQQILPHRGLRAGLRSQRSELDAPRFRPDRSSTPFEAEIRIGMERSTHRFDPFSDIELSPDR